MKHTSVLFNFQKVINYIRGKAKEGKAPSYKDLLDDITEETEFEDLPFYKEHLSLYEVENDFGDFELAFPSVLLDYKADAPSLVKIVAASFSSTYDFVYDDATRLVSLIIMLYDHGSMIKKAVEELRASQVRRLFEIYIEEQFNVEAMRLNSEDAKRSIENERKVKLMVYQKKIRQLKKQIEKADRMHEAQNESDGILSDLDDLLNS